MATIPVPGASSLVEDDEEKRGLLPGLNPIVAGVGKVAQDYKVAEQNTARAINSMLPMDVLPVPKVLGGNMFTEPPAAQPVPDPVAPAAPAAPPIDVNKLQFPTAPDTAAAVAAVGPDTRTQRTVRSKEEVAALGDASKLATQTGELAQTHAGQVKTETDAEVKLRQGEDQRVRQVETEKRAKLEQRRAANDAGQQHIDKLADEQSKKKVTEYFEEKGMGAQLSAALWVGLGQFASALTGGPNSALTIINGAMDRHRQKQLDNFQRSKEFLALKQGSQDRATQALAERRVELDAEIAGMWQGIGRERETRMVQKGVPEAQRQADIIGLAAKKEENAGKLRSAEGLRSIVTTDNSAQNAAKRQMAAAGAGGDAGGGERKYEERRDAEGHVQTAEALAKLRDLTMKNPKAFAEVQKAMAGEAKANKSPGAFTAAGRMLGVTPVDMAERMKNSSPEAREIHALLAPLITAKARELDPVGALNEGSMGAARDHLGLSSLSPKELAKLANDYEGKFRRKADAAVPRSIAPMRAQEIAELKTIANNPKDPRAAGARQTLIAYSSQLRGQ